MAADKVPADAAEFFASSTLGLATFERVQAMLRPFGDVTVRTSRSQVTFRRRRGFAYLWLPGRYLSGPHAEVVLSIALHHQDASPRWKQVAHPRPSWWMHHLEVGAVDDLDDEVADRLREAAAAAG
jgi:hypothetical protein